MVEFAASGTVLFLTIVGLLKMCLAIYTYHYISEAAREGTRYAMVRGSSCSGFATACPAVSSDVQTYLRSVTYPGITSSLVNASATWAAYPSGVSCTPSATCNNPGNQVTVKVTYAFPLSIPFMSNRTLNMTSTATNIIAQ